MSKLTFHLHAKGSMNEGVKLFDLDKTEALYDSMRGMLPARFVSVADDEPETLEDGSFAPWVMLNLQVDWGGTLSWKDEVKKAEGYVPLKALYVKDFTNYIRPFRWRAP